MRAWKHDAGKSFQDAHGSADVMRLARIAPPGTASGKVLLH